MVWNRSIFYALAIGHLADRLVGKGPLVSRKFEVEKSNKEPLFKHITTSLRNRFGRKKNDPQDSNNPENNNNPQTNDNSKKKKELLN